MGLHCVSADLLTAGVLTNIKQHKISYEKKKSDGAELVNFPANEKQGPTLP
jgi:hypothetical protein